MNENHDNGADWWQYQQQLEQQQYEIEYRYRTFTHDGKTQKKEHDNPIMMTKSQNENMTINTR